MQFNRRIFLQRSLALTGASLIVTRTPGQTSQSRPGRDNDLIGRMTWLNPPATWSRTSSSDGLLVHSSPQSDFWREPPDDVRDTGHFLHLQAGEDFTFQARVGGEYAGQYDHAGLMVRINAENWMKCGSEFYDGQRHASVVFTRGFSDWSTMADLSQSSPVFWKVIREKSWIEVLCSLDGKNFTSVRQGYFMAADKTDVGIMCASPKGPGFTATFEHLQLS